MDCLNANFGTNLPLKALTTTRIGGVSQGAYESLNLSPYTQDHPDCVQKNQRKLWRHLEISTSPILVHQEHKAHIVFNPRSSHVRADAVGSEKKGYVCAIATADCLPIFLFRSAPASVLMVHAGWRGMVCGILEAAVRALEKENACIYAAFGPCISQKKFRVGADVASQIVISNEEKKATKASSDGGVMIDLQHIARMRLERMGVFCGPYNPHCTYAEKERFFSYRRSSACGRMLSLMWLV